MTLPSSSSRDLSKESDSPHFFSTASSIPKEAQAETEELALSSRREQEALESQVYEKQRDDFLKKYGGIKAMSFPSIEALESKDSANASPSVISQYLQMLEDGWGSSNEKELKIAGQLLNLAGNKLKKLERVYEYGKMKGFKDEAWKKFKEKYQTELRVFAEIRGSMKEKYEHPELQNKQQACDSISLAMETMTMDQALNWSIDMMRNIDKNNWQSKSQKDTYLMSSQAIKLGLRTKLMSMHGSPDFVKNALKIANLFTGRGNDIDNNLKDPDFAASILRDAVDFNDMAMAYGERNIEDLRENPLSKVVTEKKQFIFRKLAQHEEVQNHPKIKPIIEELRKPNPRDIKGLSAHYQMARMIETLFTGEKKS